MTEPRSRRPRAGTVAPHAVCVFAVRRGREPEPAAGVVGHGDGGPLRVVPAGGGLWAVVQDVPAAGDCAAALRAGPPVDAEGLEALRRCVRVHHAVVTAFAGGGDAVPLPPGTLHASEERARAALVAGGPRFEETLARIAGRAEWAVTVGGVPEPVRASDAESDGVPAEDAADGPPPCGRAYLARVLGRRQERARRRARAVVAAELLDRAVRPLADAAVRRRPHGPGVTGPDRPQVLNAAYLLPRERAAELGVLIQRLRGEREFGEVEIEVTGPWVPYSFVGTGTFTECAPPASDDTPPVAELTA